MTLVVLFLPRVPTVAPTVVTNPATSVGQTSAILNGQITSSGGEIPTVRGFQFNTVEYPDRDFDASSSYPSNTFTYTISDLTPGQTYYYRAYATNAAGTSYGAWVSFVCSAATYNITINSINRTTDILNQSIVIEDILNDQQNTCRFSLVDRSGNGIPATDQEIVITLNNGTKIFAGYILNVVIGSKKATGKVQADISCIDYVRLFDRNLVNKAYTSQTDKAIIQDIVSVYCPGFGITTTNVVEGVTIDQINFNYVQPSQALRRICDLTGRNWYIDYDKDIHYFPLTTSVAPFNITSSSNAYFDLRISKDASQLKNRVYVRGGTKLSDATVFEEKGDGAKKQFVLPDKPHNVSVAVNGVAKTLGVKNIDTSGYDFYLNYQEKYIEQDAGAAALTSSQTLTVNYKYDIPILVAVEDTTSINTNGVKEFIIVDTTITTTQAARDRASAELTDYANSLIEGSFKTYENGFRAGQYININLSDYGINDNYLIQKVRAIAFGAGHYYYEISIASAKTMGIIRFLIELLENNKNLVEVSDDEVVDNLLTIGDSLNADSLLDALTIDSAGPYSTWCLDSLETTQTRAVWDLFQW